MAIGTRSWANSLGFSGGLPPGIKWLLISNIGIFVIRFFTPASSVLARLFDDFALVPALVVQKFFVWQLVTYLFLNIGIWQIAWNAIAIWMFGTEFEQLWGTRRFLQFYFACGIGAGICVIAANYAFGRTLSATFGCNGAIYGLLLASAVLWPDRQVMFNFLIPMKMKVFVIVIGALAFFFSFGGDVVSQLSLLFGGTLFAYLFLKLPRRGRRSAINFSLTGAARESYRQWKLARARRKFQVYMRKQKSDRDNYVN